MTRVLMTADAVGGVWTYALDLARALSDVDVVLATMGPRPSDAQRAEAAALPNVTLVESDFALEWMSDPWTDVARAGEWLLELERRHAPDLVHLNGYAHGALSFRAPKLIVAHSCVCSWFDQVKGAQPPAEFASYRFRVARGLRAVDHVVAISRAMLAALHRHYGWLPRTSVIHNGHDARLFSSRQKEPFVFAAGRAWDEAKNLAALQRVAGRLPVAVRIAGGALTRAEVADELSRAAIYAFPALYEPFGLSVLEAALSECALVLADIPSLRELWDGDALFVPPRDDDALARAITLLARDEELRLSLAGRARTRAAQYSMTAAANGYRALYRALSQGDPVRCAS